VQVQILAVVLALNILETNLHISFKWLALLRESADSSDAWKLVGCHHSRLLAKTCHQLKQHLDLVPNVVIFIHISVGQNLLKRVVIVFTWSLQVGNNPNCIAHYFCLNVFIKFLQDTLWLLAGLESLLLFEEHIQRWVRIDLHQPCSILFVYQDVHAQDLEAFRSRVVLVDPHMVLILQIGLHRDDWLTQCVLNLLLDFFNVVALLFQYLPCCR